MSAETVFIIDSLGVFGAAIPVVCTQAGAADSLEIGEVTNSFLGDERRTVRAEKRRLGVTTSLLSAATKDAIQARVANRRHLTCNGSLLGNVPTLVSIKVTRAEMTVGEVTWEMALSINEV